MTITPKKKSGDEKVASTPNAMMTSTERSQIAIAAGFGAAEVTSLPDSRRLAEIAASSAGASIMRDPFGALRTPPCLAARASRGPQREHSNRLRRRHDRASPS